MDRAAIVAQVEKGRAEQSLPPRITDPAALRAIAGLVIPAIATLTKPARPKAVQHA